MKKLLLTFIITLISGSAFAQDQDSVNVNGYKVYNIDHATKWAKQDGAPGIISSYKGRRVYYDYRGRQYLLEKDFARKYGTATVKALDKLWLKSQLYEESLTEAPKPKGIKPRLPRGQGKDGIGQFTYKMDPRHVTIGASLIGVSATAYMLTNSIIESKLMDETDVDKIKSLSKTRRAVGFICTGVSAAGVIVVLTGLHKEYAEGVKLAHNLTISDYGAGISLTKKF